MDIIASIKENDTPERLHEIKNVHIEEYYELHLILFRRYFDGENWIKINLVINSIFDRYPMLVDGLFRKTFLHYQFRKIPYLLRKMFFLYKNLQKKEMYNLCHNFLVLNLIKPDVLENTEVEDLLQILNFQENTSLVITVLDICQNVYDKDEFYSLVTQIQSKIINMEYCLKHNNYKWFNKKNKKLYKFLKKTLPFNDNIQEIIIRKIFTKQP